MSVGKCGFVKSPFSRVWQVCRNACLGMGGGLIGAAVVLGSIIAGPKIGALALVGLLLIGQLIASVLMDHFGWFSFPIQKMSEARLLGILLLGRILVGSKKLTFIEAE